MEERRRPLPGDIYHHFKGNRYEIITIAIHTETEEEMVVYRQLYGGFKTFVRPLSMFLSEVDHVKYPGVSQKYRFELWSENEEETKKEESPTDLLTAFLDADTLEEKLKVLEDVKETPSDLIINNMALACDIVIEDGKPEERLEELVECLKTKARFECSRLR